MSLPEQICVPDALAAAAPYNFIPLPERVVLAEKLPDQDRYDPDRLSGRIDCRLTTASPLYIRAGWQPEDFVAHGEKSFSELKEIPGQQERRAAFFHHGDPQQRPRIPGSSLRGMLRALVEIVGYGKMERVTERGLVYRAVGDTTSLGNRYRDRFIIQRRDGSYQNIVQAGYMQHARGSWQIIPAQVQDGFSFARVERSDIIPEALKTGAKVFVTVDPPRVYTHARGRVRLFYPKVSRFQATPTGGLSEAVLVCSGDVPRKHMEFVVYPPDPTQAPLGLPQEMIDEYREQLTQDQTKLLGKEGVLQNQNNHPVFYLVEDGKVVFFGHAMMFRLPYISSPRDFVPQHLREPAETDLADAIFGYVRPGKVREDQARAGRVFVSDAELDGEPQWCEPEPVTPQILSGPKPTTFQHYLVQTSTQKRDLHHYASSPTDETVVRGQKRYWHKPPNTPLADMIVRDQDKNAKADSQYTRIKPLAPGVSFRFTLRFENLSQIELGALLWVLDLAADERYRLALGMGKPLGMGAVSISSSVYKDDRKARYAQLFDGAQWQSGAQPMGQTELAQCREEFEGYVLEKSEEQARGYTDLKQPLRMQCLLAMLSWKEAPPVEKTRYMEIERPIEKGHIPAARIKKPGDRTVNEYAERPALPSPTVVMGWKKCAPAPQAAPRPPQRQQATPTATPAVSPAVPAPSRNYGSNVLAVGEVFSGKIKETVKIGVKVLHPAYPDIKKVIGLVAKDHQTGPFQIDRDRWFEIIAIQQEETTTILWLKPTKNPASK